MSNSVSPARRTAAARGTQTTLLYAADGARKYLNSAERRGALIAMQGLPEDKALFAMTLAWTGARISEVLALTASSFQVEAGVVAIVTLKRRRFCVREVPLPPELIGAIDRHFHLTNAPHSLDAEQRLWPFSRTTAWRLIKSVMEKAKVSGRKACPKGLRHAFGVGTIQAGVPLNLTKVWLGHASLSTTAIYTAVSGPEEMALAARFWETSMPRAGTARGRVDNAAPCSIAVKSPSPKRESQHRYG
jgi:site-specific recombinase XerD